MISTFSALGALQVGSPFKAAASDLSDKQLNLSDDELISIVTEDVEKRQFLVTGDLTRRICTQSPVLVI